jgi:ribose/xylose/arabinose/galactoside ABC-type transport system permease subunit
LFVPETSEHPGVGVRAPEGEDADAAAAVTAKADILPAAGSKAWLLALVARAGVVPALILVVIIGAIVSPSFLTTANFTDVLTTASVVGLLALGEGLVIIAGGAGIDLSVAATMILATIVAARMQNNGEAAVVITALLTGGFVGVLNGLGVTVARLEPFIVTLGTLTCAQGAAYYLSGASPLAFTGNHGLAWLNDSVAGIRVPIIVFVVAVVIIQVVMSRTVFGRELYVIGGNEEAAHYAGIPVQRHRFIVYLLSGVFAGGAALLVIAQLGTADPNFGSGYNLSAIAAVVVGGVPLSGGRGTLLGTGCGVLVIALVNDILGLLNVSTYVQLMATGLIVLLVVGLNRRGRGSGARDALRALPLLVGLAIAGLLCFVVLGHL